MDSVTEKPLPTSASKSRPVYTRRKFLGVVAAGLGVLGLKAVSERNKMAQPAVISASVPSTSIKSDSVTVPTDIAEEASEANVKSLAQSLARGWVVNSAGSEDRLAAKTPEVWEGAARKGLKLCMMLYKNRQQIVKMASETFPQVKLNPEDLNYYEGLAIRRAKLESCDLALYLAILATEDSRNMKTANCYIGNSVRVLFDPGNTPREGEYDSDKAAIWRLENFFLGVRAMQGLYKVPAGKGLSSFDLTAKGLNTQLLRTYNVNPLWEKRVASLYAEIKRCAQNTPTFEYLAENLIPNLTTQGF